MALKMTGSRKFEASSKQRLFADPERVKKDLENERRITRLQQVREKSNNIARHIRQEVAAEKARQIQNLENVKQQELNAWHEHVVAKKYQDYRTSMFQVGAAHRAAQAETEKCEQQKQQRAEKMQKCRRLAAKRIVKHTPTNILPSPMGKVLNVEGRATAGTQTPVETENKNENKENRLCNNEKCKQLNESRSIKRKRTPCNNRKTGIYDVEADKTLSECSSDESVSDHGTGTERGRAGENKLQTTPPVILDVDLDSEDSLEVCAQDGIEINDLHIQNNRKFSRVVRANPTKSVDRQSTASIADGPSTSRPRFTQITDLVRRTTLVMDVQPSDQHTPRSPTKSLPRSPTRAKPTNSSESPSKTATRNKNTPSMQSSGTTQQPQKRSSLKSNSAVPGPSKVIDAGVRRSGTVVASSANTQLNSKQDPVSQQNRQQYPLQHPTMQQLTIQQPATHQLPLQQIPIQQFPMPQISIQQAPIPAPPYLQPAMNAQAMYAPQMMPPYSVLAYPIHPYPGDPINQYTAQPNCPSQYPVTTSAVTASAPPAVTTATHSAVSSTTVFTNSQQAAETNPSVQFYDHNNKYYRNYKAPTQVVQANRQDNTNHNAMENARIETQIQQIREQDLQQKRQVTDQRCQKALEREQVRRDCAELTEKLDALTQQQPNLLPSDANFVPSHRYADSALRREQKMNAEMEKILLAPSIVTCPEVGVTRHQSPRKTSSRRKSAVPEAINVGNPPLDKPDDVVSSTSCSILLDYVDNQSQQLRTELRSMQTNSAKSIKLKDLLQRIEKIRTQLLYELQGGEVNGDNAQKVIDSIRKERANIQLGTERDIDQRELELQQKEALLEQHLRQLYKQQRQVGCQQDRKKKDDKPVEIIIKVRSDGTVKKCLAKENPKEKLLSVNQNNVGCKSTTSSSDNQPSVRIATAQPIADLQTPFINERQHSIDSNSTSYRELPPVIYKNIRSADQNVSPTLPEPLDPIIAHYVQRLLRMPRSNIDKLSVSTSEVPTPSESIVNQSGNVTTGHAINDTLMDNQRVERVEAIIQENRSLINEIDNTLRSQEKEQEQHVNNGNSQRKLDQMGDKRKQKEQQQPENRQKQQQQQPQRRQQQPQHRQEHSQQRPLQQQRQYSNREQKTQDQQREIERSAPSNRATSVPHQIAEFAIAKSRSRGMASQAHQQASASEVANSARGKTSENSSGSKSHSSGQPSAAVQMERYAQLTENCTQRIAELTDLITKVREEKQRLVEVTLTSASEGDRHSTEYFELPAGQAQEQHRSRTLSARSEGHDTTPSQSEALPLQKHKPTGASLDSGISISRPLTAMGQEQLDAEPISIASAQVTGQRRNKVPPATIRRYSPQLAVEEMAHELSTITEVDTPAQSHMATTAAPMPFPIFEEYARELQIDVANLDVDQSLRLQREFNALIEAIKQSGHGVDYREFASINAYLHELTTAPQAETETDQQSLTARDLFQQLRLRNISIREFPNRREYLQQLLAHEPPDQREMIDSASLESSDSLNVEAELQQRKIIRTSFRRRAEMNDPHELDVASSTRRESLPPNISTYAPNESDIEPLSRSPMETDRHLDMDGMISRSVSVRQRHMEREHPHSGSEKSRHMHRPAGGGLRQNSESSSDAPQDASQLGRSLNLREFLTKELLRHRVHNRHSSNESIDESLKSNFLQSVIDSLSLTSSTPQTPAQGHATNGTNDRQKTSTPVGSFFSTQEKSKSMQSGDSQLFSVESRISAVHYADGTPPVPYEKHTISTGKASAERSSKTPILTTTTRKSTNPSRK